MYLCWTNQVRPASLENFCQGSHSGYLKRESHSFIHSFMEYLICVVPSIELQKSMVPAHRLGWELVFAIDVTSLFSCVPTLSLKNLGQDTILTVPTVSQLFQIALQALAGPCSGLFSRLPECCLHGFGGGTDSRWQALPTTFFDSIFLLSSFMFSPLFPPLPSLPTHPS